MQHIIPDATTAPCPCTNCCSKRARPKRRMAGMHAYTMTYRYQALLADGTYKKASNYGDVEEETPLAACKKLRKFLEGLGHKHIRIETVTLKTPP